MTKRPIFIPKTEEDGYVDQIDLEIQWAGGFAQSQKQKNISALHAAARFRGYNQILEISTKSSEVVGRHLSAFHLQLIISSREVRLESAFQGSKVFEKGGPYTDLYDAEPGIARRDPRLRNSGSLIGFYFDGCNFPLAPRTTFYDWLYLNAIFTHRDWLRNRIDGTVRYDGFSDIEFNPKKSVNCQAKSCALFVSLMREEKMEKYMESPEAFISAMSLHSVEPSISEHHSSISTLFPSVQSETRDR